MEARRALLRWIPALLVPLALLGCQGMVTLAGDKDVQPPPGGGPPPPPPPPDLSDCRMPSQTIYAGLYGACVGCHSEHDNRPFFASLEAFERQVAYSAIEPIPGRPVLVHAGDPDGSELVALLEGTSESLGAMPPGDDTYAEMAAADDPRAGVTMAQVRAWVTDLEVCELPAPPPVVIARRMPPEMIRSELMRQLGLSAAEVDGSGRPLGSPDDSPQRLSNDHLAAGFDAWQDLGGAHHLDGRRTSLEISEAMVQTLVPLSQAWCAISTRDHEDLFEHASRDSSSATDGAAIRDNIEFLFLHMLGEEASDASVTAMYEQVFVPTEMEEGSETAWTAVCSAFVRDPLWLTY